MEEDPAWEVMLDSYNYGVQLGGILVLCKRELFLQGLR